ncbi:MAG: DASS family sodium-coupled anion symporter [Veillonella sp.]|nr:DASS family sodium-coupled anion symporter [Veillonella sp.]
MFATAMAPNLLAADYMNKLLGVDLNWGLWAMAMIVPGLILLVIVPAVGYATYRPELKKLDNKKIAAEGLEELGPMKATEKILVAIFILALLGWAMPSILEQGFGIKFSLNATAVAIVAMVLALVTKVIDWKDVLESKGAWNTFIWFGGIIGLSSALSKAKFFEWLAQFMSAHLDFGSNAVVALVIIGALSILVRYLFASGSAYVVAMLPVFLTVGKVAGVEPMALALVLAATNAYGGMVTHYGGAAGPIIFGAGYNGIGKWWTTGGILAVVSFIVTIVVGYAWWSVTGII